MTLATPVHNIPLTVGEVFKKLESAQTKNERADILKAHDSLALRSLLRLNFDPNIEFELPEGVPERYKPNNRPLGMGETSLKAIVKKFYIFTKQGAPKLRQSKREIIFLQTLEQLDAFEAKLLLDAKDKKLEFGLTKKLVDEVFPGILPEEISEPVVEEPVLEAESPKEQIKVVEKPKTKKSQKPRKKSRRKDEAEATSSGV